MSDWLHEQTAGRGLRSGQRRAGTERALRAFDVAVALLALLPLALPLLAARCAGKLRPVADPLAGDTQARRHELVFADTTPGRLFKALGARHWPVLLDVLAGRMSWVGPRSLAGLPAWVAQSGVRPGVVSLWSLRRRTAVDFISEQDSDYEYLGVRGLCHDAGLLLRSLLLMPLRSSGGKARDGRVRICDVAFDNVNMAEAIARIGEMLDGDTTHQVSFVNPACVNIAAVDRGYRRALARASFVLPDGIGTKIGADMLATPIKQNVNGTDLFPRLCEVLAQRRAKIFLLGGGPGVPEAVAARVTQQWPGTQVVGCRHGFYTAAEEGEVVAEVRNSGADIVFIARGVPMQDIFIDRYLSMFGVRVVMGVGGLFDFVAGRIDRAPRWMRDSGLEWMYRLMQEPTRMWRRYLVGNFTFLARVALQRLGLRAAADDCDVEDTHESDGTSAPHRGVTQAVLFACEAAGADLPVDADHPAALWPLGCSSFVERALEHLAEAGVRVVDLVVSHRPEALRQVIGAGERWGLTVRWHLARDAHAPYGILRSHDWSQASRVVIGHAEHWIGRGAVKQLADAAGVACQAQASPAAWTGWASLAAAALGGLDTSGGFEALALSVCNSAAPVLILPAGTVARADTAEAVLQAQSIVADEARAIQVPGSWIRAPWGAMSPSARVHPTARLLGPVLLGPGCLVDEGAQVGPHVVLTRDVVVASGSLVRDAIVMPDTFIGKGLDVDHAIVSGNRIHPLGLGVTIRLPSSDGLLMKLRGEVRRGPSWSSRALAATGVALLAPWVGADAMLRPLRGAGPRWQPRDAALRIDELTGEPLTLSLREPVRAQSAGPAHPMDAFGPLLDVVQGRRCWLGVRPRSIHEWEALPEEWRQVLIGATPGVFHAPAWSAAGECSDEADAAADVFLEVQSNPRQRLTMLRDAVHQAWFTRRIPPPPTAAPPQRWSAPGTATRTQTHEGQAVAEAIDA
jgi:N-acetylglucosaminyldiphosphoundecaprenol N-acetyl-beta-D-mannosaminyltransferase